MALLKPRRMTLARLEANRRNAQNSTGPRTARDKAQSRLNRLRHGGRSSLYGHLIEALVYAPPYCVDQTAHALLDPATRQHPLFVEMLEVACWAEAMAALDVRLRTSRPRLRGERQQQKKFYEQSQ